MSAISGFCEKCNKFRKRHCDGNRNTCMSILFDTIEALQQENEQLQAQVAQYREAVEVLETVTEHLENCYGRNTPDTEKAREALAAIDKIGGREDV